MINYSLIREDKSQLNRNNTGLHAVGEGSVFNVSLWFIFEMSINSRQNNRTFRSIKQLSGAFDLNIFTFL